MNFGNFLKEGLHFPNLHKCTMWTGSQLHYWGSKFPSPHWHEREYIMSGATRTSHLPVNTKEVACGKRENLGPGGVIWSLDQASFKVCGLINLLILYFCSSSLKWEFLLLLTTTTKNWNNTNPMESIHSQITISGAYREKQVNLPLSVPLHIFWVSFHVCPWLMTWFCYKLDMESSPSWLFISAVE